MSTDDSLDGLSKAAQAGLERRLTLVSAPHAGRWPIVKLWVGLALVAFACWVMFSHYGAMRVFLFGVPQETKLADAKLVLEASRQAVERYRAINQTLPLQVPVGALGGLVRMEASSETTYRLFFEANGIRLEMDPNGTVITGSN